MNRLIILNSYILSDAEPNDLVRIKYFFKGLEEEGFVRGKNLQVEIIDSNDLGVIESSLKEKVKQRTDLIHAIGTPNAIIAAKSTRNIPVVYYGAHPEGVGKEECTGKNICGLVLTLPFTTNYKNFRFLRKLLPKVRNVYVPFYEDTIFCPAAMKDKHRAFRSENNGPAWIPMDSEHIGYRSLAGLCYIIGMNYFEFVYKNTDELSAVLALPETSGSLLMPYNDSVYCSNAAEVLIESSHRKGIPLLWNNNPEASQIGALAAIAGCFKEAGFVTGKMAGKILNGDKPSDIGTPVPQRSFASINLKTAKIFNLKFSDDVLSYFDEVIT